METLFKEYKIPEIKKTSERAELIKFFVDNLKNKDGKPFTSKHIAVKLGHIPTEDLYFVKSAFKDRLLINGLDQASKWLWWSIKAK